MVDDSAPRIPELQALVSRVATDANVHGLILTGSWARGMATEHSDVDVYVVLQHQQGWVTTRTKEIDLPVLTLDQLQAVPRDLRNGGTATRSSTRACCWTARGVCSHR
jgi:predicted nucleotidyltransferase